MKRRNREINIFGMSSLDLFASALGAFILISIIIFPLIAEVDETIGEDTDLSFVPTPDPAPDCPVCPAVLDLSALPSCPVCPTVPAAPEPVACPTVPAPAPAQPVACPVCPAVPDPEPAAPPPACPEAPVPAPSRATFQLPHLDLVIALDVTSSMGRQVAALKSEVGQLSDLLTRLAPSFGVGLVAFGDRNWEQPVSVFQLRQISGPTLNRAAFRGFVNTLEIDMGMGGGFNADGPEALMLALWQGVRMPWRSASRRRVVVLVTDATSYPEETDQVISTAASIARMPGHRVSTVYINSSGIADPEVEQFLQRVANAGRGQFIRDAGGSLTVNLLLSLL